MTEKKYIVIAVVIFGLTFFYLLAEMFSPNSLFYSEQYVLYYPEVKVIDAINKLKRKETELNVPEITIKNNGLYDLNDGKEKKNDYGHKFYFYIEKENLIIFTRTRPSGAYMTTFAFVAFNNGIDLVNWKSITKDLDYVERREILDSFEESILKRIKGNLENN